MAATKTGFAVATIDEIEQGTVSDGRVRHKVREHFGIEGFGVNANRAVEAGGQIVNEHSETAIANAGQQELYVVLKGHARFTVDGDEIDAPAGTLVYVEPGVSRSAVADEKDTTVLIVGGAPGTAYNQTPGWFVAPMFGPYQQDDFAAAADIVRGVLAEHPGMPLALYNLACCEARLGQDDEALEHLAQAIAGDPAFGPFAQDDDDFASLRGDARYQELVG
ncbi:MAG TPA: cupin domain-containing protein [Gaiellaceae bacterium]|nr:cupin domain-containing protein [Gaiellaceae bacterium]